MGLNTKLKNVVLIGAAGNIGSIIRNALLDIEDLQVTALTRNSSTTSLPNTVKVIKTSYAEAELVKAFQGQDVVISAIGAMGFQEQKTIIDAAIKAGVKRFMPSEFSANTRSTAVCHLVPLFEAKRETLDYLKEKELTGITWTGLSTGPLLDWGIHNGFLGFDLARKKAEIWDTGDVAFSVTNADDLGKAVVSILMHPAETANKYLYYSTVTTTQAVILKALEASSRQKWKVETVKTDEQIAKGRQRLSEGDFTGMFELVKASFWGKAEGIRSNYAVDETLANSILGLPEEPQGGVGALIEKILHS